MMMIGWCWKCSGLMSIVSEEEDDDVAAGWPSDWRMILDDDRGYS